MIPAPEQGEAAFAVGRYSATLDEVYDRYVAAPEFAESATRAAIWEEWVHATSVLRQVVPVSCVWLAGSFTTAKLDPNDIDCLYWLDAELVAAVSDPDDRNIIGHFATPNSLKSVFALRIDSYVASWRSVPAPSMAGHRDWKYYRDRGYWDDWWQRQRISAAGAPPQRSDSVQRRGYLEVTFDGFSE